MFGAGGSALIAKTLGEGDRNKANRLFSLFVYLSVAFGALMMILGIITLRRIALWLGAEGRLLEDCILYGRIFILALPAWILLYEFQLFFVTAEKPKLGLFVTIAAGITNIVLDALFIIGIFSISMFILSEALARPVSAVFVGYNQSLMELTVDGFVIFSFSYLFMGMGIFSSSFFMALNNGLVSALISFLRTLVFEFGAVLLLPMIWGISGVWASIVLAEFMAALVGSAFMFALREKYHYSFAPA